MIINNQIITNSAIQEGYAHVACIWEMKDIVEMIGSIVNDLKIVESDNLEFSFFQREKDGEILVAVKYISGENNERLTAIATEIGSEVTGRRALGVVDEVARERMTLLKSNIEGMRSGIEKR